MSLLALLVKNANQGQAEADEITSNEPNKGLNNNIMHQQATSTFHHRQSSKNSSGSSKSARLVTPNAKRERTKNAFLVMRFDKVQRGPQPNNPLHDEQPTKTNAKRCPFAPPNSTHAHLATSLFARTSCSKCNHSDASANNIARAFAPFFVC